MAQSTCVKCGNTRFEMKEQSPVSSNYKYLFIQCTSCGGVVGVVEYFNIGSLIHKILDRLGIH